MLIFLYGSDGYRLKQTREEYVNRYKARYQSGVNLFTFDFSETNNLDGLDDALRVSSFFNEHKLLVCRNLFNNKATTEKIFSFLKDQKTVEDRDVTMLVIENLSEKDLNTKHKELFNFLSNKANTARIISPLVGSELSKWVKSEFQARNCQIQNEVIKKLTELTGNNSWDLINEIDKLANYSSGGEVKAEHIGFLTHPGTELNIFDLIDAIAQKNKSKAYSLLYQELKSSRDPYYILTMMIYQFRNLLVIQGLKEHSLSQTEIARKAKLHPFVVKKAMANLEKFSLEELKIKYNQLLFADISFKTGQNYLENTLYGFCFIDFSNL